MTELKKMESDPSYDINDIGDIKQLLKELGTEKAKEIALHFRRDERAAALEAILEARSCIDFLKFKLVSSSILKFHWLGS